MNVTTLAISILATWRIAHLLIYEDGPGDLLGLFRDRVGVAYDEQSLPYGKNMIARGLLCIWCLSVWVGWAIALITIPEQWVIAGLAYSAGSIIVNKVINYGTR